MAEEVLEPGEAVDAAAATGRVGEVLEFVICGSEGHVLFVHCGADAKSHGEFGRGGQDEFSAVANRATLAILRVEVVATEDREGRPCVVATLKRKRQF